MSFYQCHSIDWKYDINMVHDNEFENMGAVMIWKL